MKKFNVKKDLNGFEMCEECCLLSPSKICFNLNLPRNLGLSLRFFSWQRW